MASQFEVRIDEAQMRRTIENMKTLAPKLQKKALTPALRKGANLVRNEARRRVPVRTGGLKKAIITQTRSRQGRRVGGAVIAVGIRGGARQYANTKRNRRAGRVGETFLHGGAHFYFRFLEFGTKNMGARPFLIPALVSQAQPATDAIAAELSRQIDKVLGF